jgi:hypothetical protein
VQALGLCFEFAKDVMTIFRSVYWRRGQGSHDRVSGTTITVNQDAAASNAASSVDVYMDTIYALYLK